jgi:hypothetical protein
MVSAKPLERGAYGTLPDIQMRYDEANKALGR